MDANCLSNFVQDKKKKNWISYLLVFFSSPFPNAENDGGRGGGGGGINGDLTSKAALLVSVGPGE